ncbi:MAG: hypothetical protein ACRC7O_18605 [Fimbriiglobus sp.]
MTDTPVSTPATTPTPPAPASHNVGFLAIVQDAGGLLGGYLVTNTWGRPLEFRLTTAVQPTKVQQILYGPTLTDYVHAELIGKTLVEKTATPAGLVITDSLPALGLRSRLDVPVLALVPTGSDVPPDAVLIQHARCSVTLAYSGKFDVDRPAIEERLNRLDPAIDLAEPFTRVREAVAEGRKMGVTSRAA